ncbi:DUF397 domain-containing protein [Nocardia sp. NPDC101769]|uniref:DUF397 domain-containing protein n=1 Tax=Nocardia sp. NPDC101769 TaxID=3364333 RepID=UPI003825BB1D
MSAKFFRSTFSGSEGTCVEVAHRPDRVLVRDSKYTGSSHGQPLLAIAPGLWPTFLDLVLSGNSGRIGEQLSVNVFVDGSATLGNPQGVTLEYDPAEWDAFTKGVANGEFNR